METLEQKAINDLLAQIAKKEAECLHAILTRYYLKFGKRLSLDCVTRVNFDGRPNYWQYWHNYKLPDAFLLMGREVTILETGMPALNIFFNRILKEDRDNIN